MNFFQFLPSHSPRFWGSYANVNTSEETGYDSGARSRGIVLCFRNRVFYDVYQASYVGVRLSTRRKLWSQFNEERIARSALCRKNRKGGGAFLHERCLISSQPLPCPVTCRLGPALPYLAISARSKTSFKNVRTSHGSGGLVDKALVP